MIKEIIEDVDYYIYGRWYRGHIYISDDNRIIWTPASAPLHPCKQKADYGYFSRSIAGMLLKQKIYREPKRRPIFLNGLLAIRRVETDAKRKKGYAELLLQTIDEDTSLKGKIQAIEKLIHFLPNLEPIEEKTKAAPIYFYKDNEVISQLFEQTPEGDFVEVIREAGIKIGVKGSTEFGNDLITKLSLELSSELSEKAIIKSQITDTKKIAVITLYLIANGNAQDIMTFDIRNIPPYLYFDKSFVFEWPKKNESTNGYELIGNVGPIVSKLQINKNNIVHDTIFAQIKKQKQLRLQGLAKSNYNSDGSIILIPIILASY